MTKLQKVLAPKSYVFHVCANQPSVRQWVVQSLLQGNQDKGLNTLVVESASVEEILEYLPNAPAEVGQRGCFLFVLHTSKTPWKLLRNFTPDLHHNPDNRVLIFSDEYPIFKRFTKNIHPWASSLYLYNRVSRDDFLNLALDAQDAKVVYKDYQFDMESLFHYLLLPSAQEEGTFKPHLPMLLLSLLRKKRIPSNLFYTLRTMERMKLNQIGALRVRSRLIQMVDDLLDIRSLLPEKRFPLPDRLSYWTPHLYQIGELPLDNLFHLRNSLSTYSLESAWLGYYGYPVEL